MDFKYAFLTVPYLGSLDAHVLAGFLPRLILFDSSICEAKEKQ